MNPRRSEDLVWTRLGDRVFILELKGKRRIHRLNSVAAEIWSLADGSRSSREILAALLAGYEAPRPAEVKRELEDFISEMAASGLIGAAGRDFAKGPRRASAATKPDDLASARHGLQAEMERLAFESSTPLFATLEITLRCNLRCVHCYNFDRSEPMPKKRGAELSREEVLRLLGELSDAGTLMVSFSGGEALLHPHLLEFVRRARELHMGVKIKSNATLLTPARAEALAEAGASETDISVYGATTHAHDAFTGKTGSFERTWKGIRAAKRSGLNPVLSYVIHRGNFREVLAMKRLARREGVSYSISTEITARYDGTRGSRDHRLTREELRELISGPMKDEFSGLHDPSGSLQCACARMVCGISSSGELYPCIGAPIPSGNLRDTSFAEAWRSSPELNRIRRLKPEDFHACHPCPHRAYCQRSSGGIYVDTGCYTGPEPFTCMQAELIHELHP